MEKKFKRTVHRKDETWGQVFVLAFLMLPVMVGMGAMTVDVGYMYVARNEMQNAADAGALAGAQILAGRGTHSNAETQALNFANQNMTYLVHIKGADLAITFPVVNQVEVNINCQRLGLFLAPVIGIETESIRTIAKAQFGTAVTVPPRTASSLAIHCQKPGGCPGGDLHVGNLFERQKRHCGNQFRSTSFACPHEPKTAPDNEVFLCAMSYNDPKVCGFDISSNTNFKNRILINFQESASNRQTAYALPGTKEEVEAAIKERLTFQDGSPSWSQLLSHYLQVLPFTTSKSSILS